MSTVIIVGAEAIDRDFWISPGYTYINKENPANESGTIEKIEIFASSVNLANCEVAIFTEQAPGYFTTKDSVLIGTVVAGSKQIFDVNLNVVKGDYIGMYFSGGYMEYFNDGVGIWQKQFDRIPCTNLDFEWTANGVISLYGIGETPPPPTKDSAITGIYSFKTLK